MAAATTDGTARQQTRRATGAGPTIWREDTIAVLLSATVIGGLLLDGWNHLVLQRGELGSFFTVWHALLYAGFTANALWVVSRNEHLWKRGALPHPRLYPVGQYRLRYPFAVLGLALVGVGMVGDLAWHTLFGEETDVARVIGPFHIILFAGASLLIAAPLRSAWHAPSEYPRDASFVRLLPALLSVVLITIAGSFMLQWISPFLEWTATPASEATGIVASGEGLQTAMAARVVLAHLVLVGPLLVAMRRWTLPAGVATLVFTTAALSMSSLTSFQLVHTVAAAVLGGAAVDGALWLARRRSRSVQMFLLAGTAPLVTWPVYFVVLAVAYDAGWPVDFALGVSFLCALVGMAVAFLVALPEPADSAAPAQHA